MATVRSTSPTFLRDVARQSQLAGAARNAPIGREAPLARPTRDAIEALTTTERHNAGTGHKPGNHPGAEPLADLQWDMAMIHATATGSQRKQMGDRGVRVGIIDTGVDGSHPDIAPHFDASLSRNFTTDIPLVDGPCEYVSCVDPANEDDDGHGTHVAGTIGAAVNGIGIAGVAPNVDAGEHPGRPGFGLLLPPAVGRRAHVRRQQRHRRREHELLHRPVALQLPPPIRPTRPSSRWSSARSSRPPTERSTTPTGTASP